MCIGQCTVIGHDRSHYRRPESDVRVFSRRPKWVKGRLPDANKDQRALVAITVTKGRHPSAIRASSPTQ